MPAPAPHASTPALQPSSAFRRGRLCSSTRGGCHASHRRREHSTTQPAHHGTAQAADSGISRADARARLAMCGPGRSGAELVLQSGGGLLPMQLAAAPRQAQHPLTPAAAAAGPDRARVPLPRGEGTRRKRGAVPRSPLLWRAPEKRGHPARIEGTPRLPSLGRITPHRAAPHREEGATPAAVQRREG